MQNLDKEVKKAVEQLTAGDKIQLELDKKNQVLKIWKLKLSKVEVDETKQNRTI
jgi:ribosomal 50S subunit-recycling heat shock protein